ncbi:FtsX-like permease family protein [Bacillus tropicus]|uniref:ABC transporter permease n=1 Tax=Bacillus tropicus TaxID=2026188 RepID=A0A5C5A480_9BACI|nr:MULTISPECIES: FtsX-like permease family protein [Bacillus]ALL21469.1 ABC transporter permease [Bacillus thuringiensis]OOL13320.1 ABC transporter permease [Bacillus cereus]MCB4847111.1 FtsX-like permease family protein [Bacillus tropicus]PJZ22648.1 ABC transporter permease [Bacillus cereus]TNP13870.1 ABC transporter permease [Bacillus tropicus]
MTPFSIIKKNLQRNLKNYVLYFASMILSIVIYFIFVSLQYNDYIVKQTNTAKGIADVFQASSVILIIFVAIFIWYSNSFFTKKRKKEIALYSLLGVPKRQIGTMLFYENLIIGIIALIIGMSIGALLSKVFSMLLLKVMQLSTAISFSISLEAIMHTILIFTIIILITSFHGYSIIYKFKLIELLQAERQGEPIPKGSIWTALLGIILVISSYWFALQPIFSSIWLDHKIRNMCIILGGSIIGTYFIFRSFTVFLLLGLQKNKTRYYRGINVVSVSQLLARIQANAKTLTAIALLSAVTLCGIGASYSMYYKNKIMIDKTESFSFMYVKTNSQVDQQIENTIKNSNHTIKEKITIPLIKVKADLQVNGLMPINFEKNPNELNLLSESTFNTLADKTDKDIKVSLQNTEVVALDANKSNTFQTEYKNGKVDLHLSSSDYSLQFVGKIQDNILNDSLHEFTIVVPDKIFSDMSKQQKPYILQAYKVSDDKNTEKLTKAIQILLKDINLISKYGAYKSAVEATGLVIFAGVFLGLVFLAATGSIIYFKQLTEATIDQDKYIILRKLGVSKQTIFKSIAKQIAFIFILPLTVGSLHSIVVLKALSNTLGIDIFIPVLTTIVAYTLIYFAYYILTVKSYNNIVNK